MTTRRPELPSLVGPIDGTVIQTHSGVYINPLQPWTFDPDIDDIAWALSRQTRFSGHTVCDGIYSVAQHSVMVARTVAETQPELELAALLHDASEAYLVDLPSPIKHSKLGEGYRVAEAKLQERINLAFGLDSAIPLCVHRADLRLLATEKRDLMPAGPDWLILENVEPLPQPIVVWDAWTARHAFLETFERLTPALAVAA